MVENLTRLIALKRDGKELDVESIQALIRAYATGEFPDFQMAAFAMAVLLNGMTAQETKALTDAMLHSGQIMRWPEGPPVVDKHSTGGVGDKVSLVLAPMLAACGLRVPMISGRGLGPTGGTLDKLESIPGFRTDLSLDEILHVVESVGCVITGATSEIAPADRKLYALRDVTATVPSIPLITASIMSKKLAEGLDCLVLDVKVGDGAFMKTKNDARTLAQSLVDTGNRLGVKTSYLMTDMDQPLGRMIGNAVEVDETIDALCDRGPADLKEVTFALGEQLLLASRISSSPSEAQKQLQESIDSGSAMSKFEQMVCAQGGDLTQTRWRGECIEIAAKKTGFVQAIENEQLGWSLIDLGGGRRVITDQIDHSAGLEILVRTGDPISVGQPWLHIFAPKEKSTLESVVAKLEKAIKISDKQPARQPLIIDSSD